MLFTSVPGWFLFHSSRISEKPKMEYSKYHYNKRKTKGRQETEYSNLWYTLYDTLEMIIKCYCFSQLCTHSTTQTHSHTFRRSLECLTFSGIFKLQSINTSNLPAGLPQMDQYNLFVFINPLYSLPASTLPHSVNCKANRRTIGTPAQSQMFN